MLEAVKEKTNQEKLDDLKQEVGKAFFDYGRIKYEIEVKEKELGNISVNIHNLNHRCVQLNEALAKEAKIEGMKVELGKPGTAPELEPSMTVQQ